MDPLKVFYLDHLRSLCAHAETPTSLVDGKSLDEHDHFVCHHLSKKGRLWWDQINKFLCYAWNLCEIYDFTCCSKNPKKYLPTYVSLMIMKSYLLMQRVFIVTMISNKLKNLLLLRVLMKLLLWLKSMILLSTNLKILTYLSISMKTMLIMSMSKNLLKEWPLLWKKIMICMNL